MHGSARIKSASILFVRMPLRRSKDTKRFIHSYVGLASVTLAKKKPKLWVMNLVMNTSIALS